MVFLGRPGDLHGSGSNSIVPTCVADSKGDLQDPNGKEIYTTKEYWTVNNEWREEKIYKENQSFFSV